VVLPSFRRVTGGCLFHNRDVFVCPFLKNARASVSWTSLSGARIIDGFDTPPDAATRQWTANPSLTAEGFGGQPQSRRAWRFLVA
jgi:hypothetical protein